MTMQLERSDRTPRTMPNPARSVAPVRAAGPIRSALPVVDRPVVDRPVPDPGRLRPRVPARRRPAFGPLPSERGAGTGSAVACNATEVAGSPGYRMGRWARLSITVTVLLVGLLFATGALPIGSGSDPSVTATVTVHSGDTLWSIAGDAVPGGNTGAVVERIRDLNGLDDLGPGAVLPVGLELTVPAG